ncbi:ester cyclase [Natronosporangium hydrolyticum]|uniref:Ester cyclase n=1 Tax=Natronosporangium hydrolyticum TaxID=2811111 RepID=A0A895YIW7_9ACTN|nr:ester cyclase [Natronosporangium hydrolyticum]QSB15935.1 ester cyclase [Natronosporangium hydrolyticum]
MSHEENLATLERSIELINSGAVDAGVAALFAADAVDHDPAPGQGPGRDGLLDFFRNLRTAFPDLRMERRHLTANGSHVSMAFTVSGTHIGDFNGVPPTGRTFQANGVEIFRFSDGQVVERWGLTDDMGILSQLGLVSLPH